MDDKPITIIVTIHPAKKGKRPVTVAAAPEGELPLILSGFFPERHQLADQAFGALLKRKPMTPKIAAAAGATKKAKGKRGAKPAVHVSDEDESEADQIGPTAEVAPETPEASAAEALPEIEGDGDGQIEMQLEGSDG